MIRGPTDQSRWLDAVIARAPLGPIGEPEDAAVMILFLAFDAARKMTGQVIVVDGGETITRGRYTHIGAIAKRRSGPFRQ
jgi:NAD(P)-dependent dehydrogenase (short-subunit alcohol dehydrogenase family)